MHDTTSSCHEHSPFLSDLPTVLSEHASNLSCMKTTGSCCSNCSTSQQCHNTLLFFIVHSTLFFMVVVPCRDIIVCCCAVIITQALILFCAGYFIVLCAVISKNEYPQHEILYFRIPFHSACHDPLPLFVISLWSSVYPER